jgi:type II secretion system protein J
MRALDSRRTTSSRASSSRFEGFTLIEFLIAMSILSIIAAVSYTSFVSVRKTMDVSEKNNELMREVRMFLERLDVELSGTLYKRNDEGMLLVSRRRDLGQLTASDLVFTSIMPQSFLEVGKRGEVIRIEYEVALNELDEELVVLKKKIYFYTLPPDDFDEPAEYIIAENFTGFLLRFRSGNQWFDTWDTGTRNELPDSVELVFSLGGRTYREFFNMYISEM